MSDPATTTPQPKTEAQQLNADPQPPAYSGPAPQVPPPGGAAYYQPPYPPATGPYPPPPQGGYPPPGSYPPPGPGQYPPNQPQQPQSEQPKTTTTMIVVNATGNCPKCQAGNIVETFTLAGICCSIWFFPCGIICCLRWKRRICERCGAVFA